jgi:flagellar assembly protein FliH
MATIIRAAAIATAGRQLRRGGVVPVAAAAPASVHSSAPVTPVTSPQAVAAPAPPLPGDQAMLAREWAALGAREAGFKEAEAELAARRQQLDVLEQQLQTARQELADSRAQTLAEAERRGLELGRDQAEREVTEQVAAQGERVNIVLAALAQSRRRALDEHEDMLVELAFTAVCRILGATAATREAVAVMVLSLVAAEREPAQLRVHLHPDDLASLASGQSTLDPRLVLVGDSGVGLGGCMIEGPRGTLDARLDLQLAQLRATLLAVRGAANKNEVPV